MFHSFHFLFSANSLADALHCSVVTKNREILRYILVIELKFNLKLEGNFAIGCVARSGYMVHIILCGVLG